VFTTHIAIAQNFIIPADSLKHLKALAEQNSPEAQYKLGDYYRYKHLNGVQTDSVKALHWYQKAAESGFAEAQCELAGLYCKGKFVHQNYETAFYWWSKAAEQGYMMGQYNLGVSYLRGYGVPIDTAQAAYWIEEAAEQGNRYAQFDIGKLYYNGKGISQNYSKAVYWFRKSAEKLDLLTSRSARYLGICYYDGQGVAQDYTQAVYWFQKAADKGDAIAQCYLGFCYYNGQGVSQDYTQAVYWYRKAADQGDADAQSNLGFCYHNGQGVSQDFTQAVYWYRKAADQGHADAQSNLGVCYHNGQGVSQDYTQAVYWYRKAADQGHAQAQRNLDLCYQKINKKGTESSSQQRNTSQKKEQIEQKKNVALDANSDVVDTKIPKTGVSNDETFAVIIANGQYMEDGVADVECAENDGRIFKEYCHRVLGIPEKNVHYRENATLNQMRSEMNWISQVAKVYNGRARILFYYSGHGVPDEKTASSYLLPSDGLPYDIRSAYSLTDLYDELGSLPTQYVTVFLDACFSGSQKNGKILHKAKGAVIKAKTAMPKGNMIVISAAQGNETAHVFQQKKHGLFTYFLLKKLQESKGQVSLGDLSKYIQEKVSQYSIVEFGKSQTPVTSVSTSLGNGWYQTKLR